MQRVTMSELKSIRHLEAMKSGVTAHILRIQRSEKVDDCLYVAGIRDGKGRPRGVVSNAERQGMGIKYWSRPDFIITALVKVFGSAFAHSAITNCGAQGDDGMVAMFIEEFRLGHPDPSALGDVFEPHRHELLALIGREDLVRAGNRDTANA